MSLLPHDASFEELVQDCFLAFRGSGLMLSPLDLQLVSTWRASGVPFEVVARGIRKAAEKALWDARPGEPALRSLRACRRTVDAEIEKHRSRTLGRGADGDSASGGGDGGDNDGEGRMNAQGERLSALEAPEPARRTLTEERHARLRSALKKAAREQPLLTVSVGRLLDGLLALPPADVAEASAREERVMVALLRGLAFAERIKILREARAQAGDSLPLSGWARRQSRRFHNSAVLRKTFSLPLFW